MENIPDEKQGIDILGKAEVLKLETNELTLSLEEHTKVNIQPKGTPLGAKLKIEENGNIAPIITFDTKKLREPRKEINPVEMLDKALEDYLNGQEI